MHKSSLDAVLERLMSVFSVDSDSELARKLQVNRQTLGSWRTRQTVPYALCISVAESLSVSLDWLFTGEGQIHRADAQISYADTGNTPQEEAVLSAFRALSEDDQRDVQRVAEERKRVRDIEQRVAELTAALADINRPA